MTSNKDYAIQGFGATIILAGAISLYITGGLTSAFLLLSLCLTAYAIGRIHGENSAEGTVQDGGPS